jgi:tetratricopeptide (TPR) repeat protein
VPGGIVGFGDKSLARKYLEKALRMNPDGIDPNYFYGDYLYEEEEYAAAKEALLKAQRAPGRQGRELADEGRRREVAALLTAVEDKLQGAAG